MRSDPPIVGYAGAFLYVGIVSAVLRSAGNPCLFLTVLLYSLWSNLLFYFSLHNLPLFSERECVLPDVQLVDLHHGKQAAYGQKDVLLGHAFGCM